MGSVSRVDELGPPVRAGNKRYRRRPLVALVVRGRDRDPRLGERSTHRRYGDLVRSRERVHMRPDLIAKSLHALACALSQGFQLFARAKSYQNVSKVEKKVGDPPAHLGLLGPRLFRSLNILSCPGFGRGIFQEFLADFFISFGGAIVRIKGCLLYTSPSPRDS